MVLCCLCQVIIIIKIFYNIVITLFKEVVFMSKSDTRNPINIKIGEKIRYYRQKAGLTQETVAEQIGLTQKHISRIECGYHNSLFITIMEIAKVLNIPIDALTENVYENSNSATINTIISEISSMERSQLEMLKDNIETIKRYNVK